MSRPHDTGGPPQPHAPQCCCRCTHRGASYGQSPDQVCRTTGDRMCMRTDVIPECVRCLPCSSFKREGKR